MAVLLHLIVVHVSLFGSPVNADPLYFFSGTKEKFINNSTYSSNLNLLLSSLSSNDSAAAGFVTTTTGRVPDRIYGLTLCRGDTDTATCRSCIDTAVSGIQVLCPNCIDANIWYDDCQLRYSNQDFLHAPNIASGIHILMFNSQNVSANQLFRFEIVTTALMGNITALAVKKTSRLFATGETFLTAGNIIYGLVQCTRDLSAGDCRKCLQGTVDRITMEPLKGRMGGRALGTWCNMRYEFYKFYNGTSMLQLPTDQPPASLSPSSQPSPPSSPSSPSPVSPPTPPSPSSLVSPPLLTQNETHSPVDSSHGGSNAVDIVLAIIIPVLVTLVSVAYDISLKCDQNTHSE